MKKGKLYLYSRSSSKTEVTLGEYKGLEVEVSPADVTEEEIAALK